MTVCSPSKQKVASHWWELFLFLLPQIELTHVTLSCAEVPLQLRSTRSVVLCGPAALPSATATNHALSLTYVHRVLRAKSLSQPFTFPSLSCSNIHTATLTPHPRDFLPSLSPPSSHTSWASFLAFGLHVPILCYVVPSDLGRADMTLNATSTTFILPPSQNIIISNNIMLIELFIVNTIT